NSDIDALLSKSLSWRQCEVVFESEFRRYELIDVVVDAPTPELTAAATTSLTDALAKDTAHFRSVTNSSAIQFFTDHGLLFQPKDALEKTIGGLTQAQPLIEDLATDPSLRGLVSTLEDVLIGVKQNKVTLDSTAPTLNAFSDTLDDVLAGRPASFSWRVLLAGKPAEPFEKRGVIEVRPVLDYASVQPGHTATEALRRIAASVAPPYQARVRLTGPVAMDDEQFGTIQDHAVQNGVITFAIVLVILWLALRSMRLILAVLVNLLVGLPLTAALGLYLVGAFNVISVYFAVLFVGIGIDFAIQFSVRYRSERHSIEDLTKAVRSAGFHVAAPLTLAGGATAAGFFSFLPTDYKGVSELGLIAGFGMPIAYATSVTVLPALIRLVNPPGEPEPLGYTALAPIDNFLARHRIPIIVGVAVVVIGALPLLYWLRFDFNPINLQSQKTEGVATYLDLARDPSTNVNAIELLSPNLDAANAAAGRLAKVPEVGRATTLSNFIPDQQEEKLPLIRAAAAKLADAFDPKNALAPPSDAENVNALNEGAQRLTEAADDQKEAGLGPAAARRLADGLSKLANAQPATRAQADAVFVNPLRADLKGLHDVLQAEPVTQASLPADLVRDWTTSDGRARVSIAPRDNPNDTLAMQRFASAVLAVEPSATEGPITILEAGRTVIRAFIEAGIWALVSITILLWLVLRRFSDVLLTLIPLMLAGVVTLELCALIGMPLNFANIIAFPLLLGVGVAFKIYYIMAWREGTTHLLQTPLTRAVIFSALTTATAFGSLMFSSHPGTSSMGKLLALSLVTTLAAAALFQPILMGRPRTPAPNKRTDDALSKESLP
ncbi:MAG: MMPL family transporter, partial [Hyphomicrobiales bacterium]|nr:MMPL family transporter [Hyphomicrobiales bacterium]